MATQMTRPFTSESIDLVLAAWFADATARRLTSEGLTEPVREALADARRDMNAAYDALGIEPGAPRSPVEVPA